MRATLGPVVSSVKVTDFVDDPSDATAFPAASVNCFSAVLLFV